MDSTGEWSVPCGAAADFFCEDCGWVCELCARSCASSKHQLTDIGTPAQIEVASQIGSPAQVDAPRKVSSLSQIGSQIGAGTRISAAFEIRTASEIRAVPGSVVSDEPMISAADISEPHAEVMEEVGSGGRR